MTDDKEAENQLRNRTEQLKATNSTKTGDFNPRQLMGKCRIELGDLTQHNVMQIKCLNDLVLPIKYDERFYSEIVNNCELSTVAYFNDLLVGAACCRIECEEKVLYILTLGTLAPYRRFGIGSMLIEFVLSLCDRNQEIKAVVLHVHVNNEAAIKLYESFGFHRTAIDFYEELNPGTAYVMEKTVNTTARGSNSSLYS